MSVRTSARVWAESQHSGTELLMLLAIADFADDDGNAYPAVATLAAKCRMTPRNVNHILSVLKASGELEVRLNEGPKGTNRYRVLPREAEGVKPASPLQPASPLKPASSPEDPSPLKPASPLKCASPLKPASSTPEAGFPKPLKPASDEPSLNRHEPESRPLHAPRSPAAPAPPRPPDLQDGTRRGTRLPADWALPEGWRAWAQRERPDLDPGRTADRFADFWRAKPGKDGRKLDWFATWRNWVRNERADRNASAGTDRPAVLDADRVF